MDLCIHSGEVESRASADRIEARMAFCRGSLVLSTSYATLDSPDDISDPRFQRMIRYMTRELFQHRDYRSNNRGSRLLN